jgi:FKBP-type peptidyl-prolyl cis-trans isomerase
MARCRKMDSARTRARPENRREQGVQMRGKVLMTTMAALLLLAAGAFGQTPAPPSGTDQQAEFLAENAKKPGVQKTASGLQYEIIEAGTGPKPAATDQVKVHYRGTLLDGKEFDSSYRRKAPAVFPVNRVITGWHEALQLVPVGSKWKLYIPPELAYGEKGVPAAAIPPNAMLIFEVELLAIEP